MAGNRFRRMMAVVGVLSMAALIVAQSADAHVRRGRRDKRVRYTQEGLGLSVGIGRMELDTDLDDFSRRRSGPGLMLGLSWGLSDNVTLFGSLTGSGFDSDLHQDWSASYGEVGVKVSFISSRRQRTQPYFSGALGGALLEDNIDREYYGGGARLAGGIDYFLSRKTIFFLEAGIRVGQFEELHQNGNEFRLTDDPDFTSMGFLFGLRFKL